MWSTPIRSRTRKRGRGRRCVQNQKLRRTASGGETSPSPHPGAADAGVVHHVVEPVDEHRHPADPALGERHLQPREAQRDAGPQPVGRRRASRARGTASCTARAALPASGPRSSSSPTRCAGTPPSRSPRTRRGSGPSGRCGPTAGPGRRGSRGTSRRREPAGGVPADLVRAPPRGRRSQRAAAG